MNDFEIRAKRLEKAEAMMKENSIDALLVVGNENKTYMSGFRSSNFYVVLTGTRRYLLTDFRYIEAARDLTSGTFEVTELTRNFSIEDMISGLESKVIGIEFEKIDLKKYNEIKEKAPGKTFVDSGDIFEELRSVKDESEIKAMYKAASVADEAFEFILPFIKPGAVERDLALKMEYFMKERGASGLSFDTIFISGEKTSLPHGTPGEKAIEEGDFVTMDFGCVYDGYCSDMTRTVAVGEISQKQREVYDIVLKAQVRGCNEIKTGMKTSDADAIVRRVIEEAGYGKFFGHGLGHGVGLEIHEAPNLNPSDKKTLKEGMIITIEPGIYLPGEFGVRIEDIAVMRKDGPEIYSRSPKELIHTC